MSRGTALGRNFDLIPVVDPIDLDNSQSGDQISLRNYGGVDLLFYTGDGAAGRDLTFTIKRHVDMADATGTTFPSGTFSSAPYYYKQGATTAVGDGSWTKGSWTDTDGAAVVVDSSEGANSSLILIPIEAGQLGDGYSAISVSAVVAGGSGAKIGCCVAILRDPQVMRTPANLDDALV